MASWIGRQLLGFYWYISSNVPQQCLFMADPWETTRKGKWVKFIASGKLSPTQKNALTQRDSFEVTLRLQTGWWTSSLLIQNQAGNKPKRWYLTIVEFLPYWKYQVMVDGSHQMTLGNRGFHRYVDPVTESRLAPTHTPLMQQAEQLGPPVDLNASEDQQQLPVDMGMGHRFARLEFGFPQTCGNSCMRKMNYEKEKEACRA